MVNGLVQQHFSTTFLFFNLCLSALTFPHMHPSIDASQKEQPGSVDDLLYYQVITVYPGPN